MKPNRVFSKPVIHISRKLRSLQVDQLPVGVAFHLISQPQSATDMESQRIRVKLQNRVSHLTCRLAEELQPPLEQFGRESREGNMLGHGRAAETAGSA